MKKLLILAPLALFHLSVQAQKHVYEDLLVMFVDEKYEKVLDKAEGYTLSDATKKDALPYLYMSMSYFEMTKDEKYQTDYPKASKDALKYAEKYRKKDKENEFFSNYEDYWAELNTKAAEEGENWLDDPKGLSKSKSIFDAMTSYYPENPGPWLLLSITQYKSNLAKEGDLSVKAFDKAIADAGDLNTLPPDQKKLLKNAIIRFADFQDSKGNKSEAKKYVELGKDYFMDSPDFKGLYDSMF